MLVNHFKIPQQFRNRPHGFTLVEVLVVMGIIIILAGIVVGVQRGVYSKQAEAKARAEMQAIATALESFKLKYGDYPWIGANDPEALFKALTGVTRLAVTGTGDSRKVVMEDISGGSPGFLEASKMSVDNEANPTFEDPWGNPYHYYYVAGGDPDNKDDWNNAGFILLSEGPDGAIATTGNNNHATGNIETNADVYFVDENLDNIVYGLEL